MSNQAARQPPETQLKVTGGRALSDGIPSSNLDGAQGDMRKLRSKLDEQEK